MLNFTTNLHRVLGGKTSGVFPVYEELKSERFLLAKLYYTAHSHRRLPGGCTSGKWPSSLGIDSLVEAGDFSGINMARLLDVV